MRTSFLGLGLSTRVGWGSAILIAAVFCSRIAVAADIDPPNIVFIMADDLGYGQLGCYGQQKIRTPRLDRMAAEGLRFTQAYAGCAVCASSRSVLMTGLHMGHTPVRGNSGGIALAESDVTVAELLQQAGYVTGCFGKWGLGEQGTTGVPNKQGFDEFFGYLHQIHAHFYYPEYLWHNDRKFPLPGNARGRQTQYTHDLIIDESLKFLRAQRREKFFLYVPLTIPHYELLVPEDSLKEYAGRFPETPYNGRGRPTGYPSDYAKQALPKAATAAMITRMDRDVGRILDLLAELKLERNTLVLFTSDNGATPGASDPEFFNSSGPLRGTKGTLYEGGIRVPMIAHWPGRISAAGVSEHAWSFADLLPTLTELAQTQTPHNIDGRSAVPALLGAAISGREQEPSQALYWELDLGENRIAQAVRLGDWKGIRPKPEAAIELYELRSDIGEARNRADEFPEIMARIAEAMKSMRTEPRPQIEPTPPAGRQFQ